MAAAKSKPARALGKDRDRSRAATERKVRKRFNKKFSELTQVERDELLEIIAVRLGVVNPE